MKLQSSRYRGFILEGPDGAGKTTLAKTLADALGAPVIHNTAAREWSGRHVADSYMEQMDGSGLAPIIMDRAWPSEEPYAVVYHRRPSRLLAHYDELREKALRLGFAIIYCKVPEKVLLENWSRARREEMLNSTGQLLAVAALYEAEFKRTARYERIPIFEYNYKQPDALRKLIEELGLEELDGAHMENGGGGQ